MSIGIGIGTKKTFDNFFIIYFIPQIYKINLFILSLVRFSNKNKIHMPHSLLEIQNCTAE